MTDPPLFGCSAIGWHRCYPRILSNKIHRFQPRHFHIDLQKNSWPLSWLDQIRRENRSPGSENREVNLEGKKVILVIEPHGLDFSENVNITSVVKLVQIDF